MMDRQNPNPLRSRHRSWCGWAVAVLVLAVLVPAAGGPWSLKHRKLQTCSGWFG